VRRILLLVGIFTLLLSSMLASPFGASATVRDSHPYGITLNAKDANFILRTARAQLFRGITWARLQFAKKLERWAQNDAQMALAAKYGIYPDIVLQNFADADLTTGLYAGSHGKRRDELCTPNLPTVWECGMKSIEVLNEEPSFDKGAASCKTAATYIPILRSVHDALSNAGYIGLNRHVRLYELFDSIQQVSDFFYAFYSDPSNPGKLINYSNAHFYHHGAPPDVALTWQTYTHGVL
jgi:hypothetical protein